MNSSQHPRPHSAADWLDDSPTYFLIGCLNRPYSMSRTDPLSPSASIPSPPLFASPLFSRTGPSPDGVDAVSLGRDARHLRAAHPHAAVASRAGSALEGVVVTRLRFAAGVSSVTGYRGEGFWVGRQGDSVRGSLSSDGRFVLVKYEAPA